MPSGMPHIFGMHIGEIPGEPFNLALERERAQYALTMDIERARTAKAVLLRLFIKCCCPTLFQVLLKLALTDMRTTKIHVRKSY